MINLSVRNYSVTIAGLDCTRALMSFSGADTPNEPTNGLVVFKGSMVLGRPIGFESIDDRLNSRWAINGVIKILVANDSQVLAPPPRGAILRILESSYDPKNKKLTIQCGDALEALKDKQPAGDKSGICLGESEAKGAVVSRLLVAAGAPALKAGDSIPGSLDSPAPRMAEGNYIDQAGKIAASAGYFLCIEMGDDGNEVTRAIAVDAKVRKVDAISLAASNVADSERVSGEAPPGVLTVKASANITRSNNDATYTTGFDLGMMGSVGGAVADPAQQIIVRSWQKSDVFNRGAKIRTNTFTSYQPLGIVLGDDKRFAGNAGLVVAEHKVSTYTYEQNSPIAGKSDSDKCAQGNQGRLLSIFAETYQPRGVALKDVLATYPQGDDQIALQGDKLELMKAEVSLTSYVYDLGRVSQVGSGDGWQTETLGDGPRITTITYRPVGAIIPDEYAYKSTGTPDPTPLAISSNKSQTWQELRFGEWSEDTVEFQALALVDSTGADRLRTVYKDRPDDLRMLLLSLRQSSGEETISNSGQANPPAADTYPAAKTSKQTSVEGKAVLPSNSADSLKPKEQTLGFDYIAATASTEAGAKAAATAEAARLAGIWGPVLWGKYKTCSYSTDFNDGWRSYKPMSRIDVTEPEATFSYLGNAFAIAIAGNRCAISFDGILLGKTAVVPEGAAAPDVFPPVDVVPPYKVVAIGNAAVGASASGVAQTYTTTLLVAVGNAAVGASGFARGLTTYIGRVRSSGVVVPRQRVIARVQSAGTVSAVNRPAPVVSRMVSRGVVVPRDLEITRHQSGCVNVPRDLEIARGQMQGSATANNVPPAIPIRDSSRGVIVPRDLEITRHRGSGVIVPRDLEIIRSQTQGTSSGVNQVPDPYLTETSAWRARVQAKGADVSTVGMDAVDAFLRELATGGISSKIDLLHVYAGITSFTGLVCPVRHPANADATLNNFVSGEYSPSGSTCGLVGGSESSNKFVNHNYNVGTYHGGFDFSMGAFVRGAGTAADYGQVMGTQDNGSRTCGIVWRSSGSTRLRMFDYDNTIFTSPVSGADLLITGSLTSDSDLRLYGGATLAGSNTSTRTLDSTGLGSLRSFTYPAEFGVTNRRFVLSFAGNGLTAGEVSTLNTAVATLVAALSA
jgi:hypothetical protein